MEGKLLLTTPAKKFECQGEARGMREGVVGDRDPGLAQPRRVFQKLPGPWVQLLGESDDILETLLIRMAVFQS